MTPQRAKEVMEQEWSHRGVAHANSRVAWRLDRAGMLLVPRPGRAIVLIKTPRCYLPLYRQPRLGLPKRPRQRATVRPH